MHVAVFNRVIYTGLIEREGLNKDLKEMKKLANGLFREDRSRPRQATKIEAGLASECFTICSIVLV